MCFKQVNAEESRKVTLVSTVAKSEGDLTCSKRIIAKRLNGSTKVQHYLKFDFEASLTFWMTRFIIKERQGKPLHGDALKEKREVCKGTV